MIDFTLLDISGDNIFNSLDILIGIFNFLFWYSFYKIIIKRTVKDPFEESLKDTRIKYITGREILEVIKRNEVANGTRTDDRVL